MNPCKCVFPSPAEEEVVTLAGDEPGTAFRVYVETSREGFVRIQQLSHDAGIGWYVQKTMVLPRDVLAAMLPQLRKAQCLMSPQPTNREMPATIPFMCVAPAATPTEPATERRVS